MSITVFPYSLVRYAALDSRLLDHWTLADAEMIFHRYQEEQNVVKSLRDRLCDRIFELAGRLEDDRLRQKLIQLKRAVYNNKEPGAGHLPELETLFDDGLREAFAIYGEKITSVRTWLHETRRAYDALMSSHRRDLQNMAGMESLQKGILLSSPVLLEQLPYFTGKDPSLFKQKDHKMEISLLRYLTRMSFKTSPFSTFTYTGLMTLGDKNVATQTPVSRLKLNNSIFGYLMAIIRRHPVLNNHLIISKNITATADTGKFHFFINYMNVESFQQLPATALNKLIMQQQDGITLTEMVTFLSDAIEDADRDAIKDYLLKMAATGILEAGIGVSGMEEDWSSRLLSFLENIHPAPEEVIRIKDLFYQLHDYRNAYTNAAAAERAVILTVTAELVNGVFGSLQEGAGLPITTERAMNNEPPKVLHTMQFAHHHFTGRQIFYEDCYTPEAESLPEETILPVTQAAETLLHSLSPLDHLKPERDSMCSFFLKQYGEDASIKIFDFYRDYYYHVKKPQLETREDMTAATGDWHNEIMHRLQSVLDTDSCEIHLDPQIFPDIPADTCSQSRGLFVQLFEEDGMQQAVINAVLPGMGKVNGRFLSLFGKEVAAHFASFNTRMHSSAVMVELNDASSFNANMHPPLLQHEISMPGGNNIYAQEQRLPATMLEVRYSPDSGTLVLYNGAQQVYTYDLSLESFFNRSHLYRLLAHFNPDVRPSLSAFVKIVDTCYEQLHPVDGKEMYSWPRITYAQQLVLRRKTWQVKTAAIPQQAVHETELDYFIRLQSWRLENGLPEQVFLFLRKRSKNTGKVGTDDDYKPQIIFFYQPLMIVLFRKLLTRAGDYIYFEEVLPDPRSGNVVKEYLLQWYKYR
ncbi:MAG TPA: lantibiotic dehydratase [Chitinophaga sp.]|uniref:lantibiotic dehydratase n=1 Tax=Chitinophaga sp. TaxID=1869181 RepID=UPI002CA9A30E|nr:lantibiotic dehydratase [Chitinophaga sp.]HVI48738.1 lantibiotic dehydratase [Chitinophaga sp.]